MRAGLGLIQLNLCLSDLRLILLNLSAYMDLRPTGVCSRLDATTAVSLILEILFRKLAHKLTTIYEILCFCSGPEGPHTQMWP